MINICNNEKMNFIETKKLVTQLNIFKAEDTESIRLNLKKNMTEILEEMTRRVE